MILAALLHIRTLSILPALEHIPIPSIPPAVEKPTITCLHTLQCTDGLELLKRSGASDK